GVRFVARNDERIAAQDLQEIVVRGVLRFLDDDAYVLCQEEQRGEEGAPPSGEDHHILVADFSVIKAAVIIRNTFAQRWVTPRLRVHEIGGRKGNGSRQIRSSRQLARKRKSLAPG